MRDGRRKRLGLAEGTENPNDGLSYLDNILSDADVAGQSNILNLDTDANVRTTDQDYVSDAYNFYLGGGFPQEEVEAPVVAPDFTGGQMIDTSGGGGTLGPINLNDFEPQNQNPAYDQGDMSLADVINNDANVGFATDTVSTTPVDTSTTVLGENPIINNMGDYLDGINLDSLDAGTVTLGSGNNALGLTDPQSLAIGPSGAVDFDTGGLEDEGQAVGEEFDDTPVSTPSGNNPFGYEDLNPSLLANPAIANTSGLNDIGADIGIDNTVDYGMPQGSPGQLNPAAPSIDDITGLNQIQDSPDMDDGIGLTRQELYEQQDTSLTETLKNKFGSLLPENFNVGTAIGKIFVNSIVGKPITLAFDIAKSIFGMLPEGGRSDLSNVLGEQYGMDDIGRLTGGPMAGYSVDSAFGDIRQATVDRINSIKNRTITQTPASIAKIKELEQFLAQVDYIGGDPIGANTDIDIDTGNVTGDASVAEDAQDLNLTEVKDDMADINTGDAGIAEQIEADNRAAEAQAAAAREAEIDANREAAKDAQNEQNAQNARDAAAAANAAARQQALADLYRGGGGDGGGGGGSGDGNSPGGGGSYCFDPSTPIQMADGSIKEIKNIQLGDDTKGGEVTGVFQFKASDDIHNYKGVTVAGGHYVKENNEFIMVKDSPLAIKIDKIPVVYSLDTANRRIFIKNIEFADYNGDGVAKNFLSNAGVTLEGFDKEVLRQVQQRLI